jgi:hypothetical protein
MMRCVFGFLLLLLGVAGGCQIALAQSLGTFTATGDMMTPRSGWYTATLLANGKVLIAGGAAGFTPLSAAELYDPVSGTFTPTGNMRAPRLLHTATLLPDGRVLIAGGSDSQTLIPTNGAEIYDPSIGTFAATGNMIFGHACQQATLLGNGKVLILGGDGANDRVPYAELYDPATGTFAPAGTYASDISGFNGCQGAVSALLPDGRVSIIWEGAAAEIYDPDTGSFTPTRKPIAWSYSDGLPTATLLMNGKVLVAGGADDSGIHASAELYDSSIGIFTATGNMTTGRNVHTATLLPDGTVLVAGTSLSYGEALASAELYDPVTGTFSVTGTMTTARGGHTATLLNNGRVLIAGANFNALSSTAELYTPRVLVSAPVLFSLSGDGRGQGAIWDATTGQIPSPASPAIAGEVLSMYTTSLVDGGAIPPQVSIGGRLAEVLFFGNAPAYPGYNQVNFRVPAGIAPGSAVPVRLTYLGRPSNEVNIGVQ